MGKRKIVIAGRSRIYIVMDDGMGRLPHEGEVDIPPGAETFTFGECLSVSCHDIPVIPERLSEVGLRESWGMLSAGEYAMAAKGAELLNWSESERYCGSDGTPLVRDTEISKRCPCCGREFFPRLNPAIVVLVTRGEEALLVHARNFRGNIHALVAGYVETGETLEECVAREVMEETSLEVDNVRYVGSQSWPFPYQLMMGFTASYKGGDLRFADGELTSGGFFRRDSIPDLPTLPSLSRRIIDTWLSGKSVKYD